MGHQIDDMVVSCSFAGRTCYPENFTLYQTAEYGNCYTLQSDKFVSRKSGPIGGLSIVLNLESGEYIEPFTNGKGARLVVHDRNSVPFPYEDGIYISSSFESHVGLKLFDITRLGTPFGKCETGETMKNAYGIQYTRQTCQVLCIQTSIIDTCGCYQEDEGKYLTILKKTNINHCRETHEIACMSKILVSAFNNENCDCPNPCKETVYTKTLSSHQWPTNKYATLLAYSLCMDKPGTCNGLRNTDDWRDMSLNFLKVMVYFEDLNYEQITEEPAITATQIMSDVGGAIGLWIGLCIVSIFEVVHLLIGMAVHAHGWCLHYGRSDAENRSKSKSDLEAGRTEKHQEQTYK